MSKEKSGKSLEPLILPLFEETEVEPNDLKADWLTEIYAAIPKEQVQLLTDWCQREGCAFSWSDIVRMLVRVFIKMDLTSPGRLEDLENQLAEKLK